MFRTLHPAAVGAAIALALTLGLSACQADDPAPAAPESVSASPSPSVSPTPTDATAVAEEKNVADAEKRYKEYVAISDKHAKKSTSAYEELVVGGYLGDSTIMASEESYWTDYAKQKLRQTGNLRVASMKLIKYEGDPLASGIAGHRVRMEVCIDNSGVDVIRRDGTSVIQKGAPNKVIMDVLMQGQESRLWSVRASDSTGKVC